MWAVGDITWAYWTKPLHVLLLAKDLGTAQLTPVNASELLCKPVCEPL